MAVGIPLWLRSRRRGRWRRQLTPATDEVVWFARVLLPQLQGAATASGLAGGWLVGLPRVSAVQDRLAGLVATAPDDHDRARAERLAMATREARVRIDAVVAARTVPPSADLADAVRMLEAALQPASGTAN